MRGRAKRDKIKRVNPMFAMSMTRRRFYRAVPKQDELCLPIGQIELKAPLYDRQASS